MTESRFYRKQKLSCKFTSQGVPPSSSDDRLVLDRFAPRGEEAVLSTSLSSKLYSAKDAECNQTIGPQINTASINIPKTLSSQMNNTALKKIILHSPEQLTSFHGLKQREHSTAANVDNSMPNRQIFVQTAFTSSAVSSSSSSSGWYSSSDESSSSRGMSTN